MTWVRLDDNFPENPKMARLSDTALALFVVGLAYCNRNLTDGFIPNQVGLGQLRWCDGNAIPAIRELEGAGCWDKTDGGWQVHDFHDYQPSRAAVLAEREAAKERMQRLRSSLSSDVRANNKRTSATPVPVPQKQKAPNGASSDTVKEIYDHWRQARSKTNARYDAMSTERRRKIQARLREFPALELRRAIDAVSLDPWEDRPRHDDLTVIFRSREQVDRFLAFTDERNRVPPCPACGIGGGLHAADCPNVVAA